jgi:hypothetical protein
MDLPFRIWVPMSPGGDALPKLASSMFGKISELARLRRGLTAQFSGEYNPASVRSQGYYREDRMQDGTGAVPAVSLNFFGPNSKTR